MIPNEIVQDIISKVDIVEVIKEQVKLDKKGLNYTGLCPFHNEKTPSFSVSSSKGIFKCFGCGESGNAVGFVMKTKNIGFVEAIKELGKKYNVAIPEREYSPEEQKEINLRQDVISVNTWAMKYFEQELKKNETAVRYISNRFETKEYQAYNIGYADSSFHSFFMAAINAGYSIDLLKNAELITQKGDKNFDFFIDRLIFPIISLTGQVLGFTGRVIHKDSKFPKYMNTRENIVFNKSKVLYGINTAYKSIKEKGTAIIVEGNTDVMRMQQNGYLNTIAGMGTSFTKQHAQELKSIVKRAIVLMDGDEAGQKALAKTAYRLLEAGILVQTLVLPPKEDPDSFFRQDRSEWFDKNKKDFILDYSVKVVKAAVSDPLLRVEALNEVAELLSLVNDKAVRESYKSELIYKLKSYKVNLKMLNSALSQQNNNDEDTAMEVDGESLPAYLDDKAKREYFKYGFYEGLEGKDINQYFFGPGKRASNFIIIPIFHIKSVLNARKIFELRNKYNYSVKIDIDMQEMTSLGAFRKVVEGQGNFLLECNEQQFMKIRAKLYDYTVFCESIDNLGWQKTGFWAWANGIQTQSEFIPVDDDGVVKYRGKNYYIPAYSSIYIEDLSLFMEERKFRLIKPQTKLKDWSKLFVEVFGDNGKIGIAFWVATLFRDFILRIFKNFPLLNLFGPKGTGKSQMAMSMMALFGEPQTTANIHNITKPGLADHISRFINAFAWIDEYKNALDFDKIETLKSIYDSIGRSRMNMDKGKKKETTLVNSAIILSGQEMPTADIALFSRVIFLMFTQSEFSEQAKSNYDQLKAIEREGLSDYSNTIIQYYSYFEKEFYGIYDSIMSELAAKLMSEGVEDRVLRNWAAILASFDTISRKIEFSFDTAELMSVCTKSIIVQTKQSRRSDEVGIFWEVFESLFDHDILISGWNFKIDYCDSIKTKYRELPFSSPKNILKFKFTSIARLYSEHGRRMGVKTLPHDTLRTYLENHKHFIGVSKSERFRYVEYSKEDAQNMEHKQVTTAYCFDYDMLDVNLDRDIDMPEISINQ